MLLNIETIWHAENDKSRLAANSMISGFSLARSLVKEPLYISQLVRMAYHGLIISSLERCINRTAFTDGQLDDLDRYLIEAEDN